MRKIRPRPAITTSVRSSAVMMCSADCMFKACERSGSDRISSRRSNLFLRLPVLAQFPAPQTSAPPLRSSHFFHNRSPLRSLSPDQILGPLRLNSNDSISKLMNVHRFFSAPAAMLRGISCRNSVYLRSAVSVRPSVCLSHAYFVTKPNNALWIF